MSDASRSGSDPFRQAEPDDEPAPAFVLKAQPPPDDIVDRVAALEWQVSKLNLMLRMASESLRPTGAPPSTGSDERR